MLAGAQDSRFQDTRSRRLGVQAEGAPAGRRGRASGDARLCEGDTPGLTPQPSPGGSVAIHGPAWPHPVSAPRGEPAGASQRPPPFLWIEGRQYCFRSGFVSLCASVCRRKQTLGGAGLRTVGHGERARCATFWRAPTPSRGLSPSTFLPGPGPNTGCSAGLGYEDGSVTPESFSLGSSVT